MEKRRFCRLNYPGTPRGDRKLHIVLEGQWPPRSNSSVSILSRVDEKVFECSTEKCYFETPRADYLARHVKNCTVIFIPFYPFFYL